MSQTGDFSTTSITPADMLRMAQMPPAHMYDMGPRLQEWGEMQKQYEIWWAHYDGISLRVKRPVKGSSAEEYVYPLRINPYAYLCKLHAALLWGTQQTDRLFRLFIAKPKKAMAKPKTPDAGAAPLTGIDAEDAAILEFIDGVFEENSVETMFREAGRIFQALGGAWFKVTHDPGKAYGVTIQFLLPSSVFPVWDDKGDLLEVFVLYWLTAPQAREYGYAPKEDEERVLYTEHWTRDAWEILIGEKGQVARDADGNPMREDNPYIFPRQKRATIPFIYIPRERTGDNYGQALHRHIIGLVAEMNSSAADMGDAINDASHRVPWIRDYRGRKAVNLANLQRGEVIDLGETPPSLSAAEIGALDPPSNTVQSLDYLKWLDDQIRYSTSTAGVIMGIDEGSQRSGDTLTARALPTLAVVADYRAAWSAGINRMTKLAVLCGQILETTDIADLDGWIAKPDFAGILPKEFGEMAQTQQLLYGAGLRSLFKAVEAMGDVQDVAAEVALIQAEAQQKAEAELAKLRATQPPVPNGQAAASGNKPKPSTSAPARTAPTTSAKT